MAYPLGPMTRAPARPDADPTPVTAAAEPAAPASQAMLSHAVEEAARLLEADGAMVYLVDDGLMRFAVDAGIRNPEAQQLIRDLTLPIGVGIFGFAAATGELVVTADYRRDKRFAHSEVADRIVLVANMRSMAAAPLIADGEVLGALGAYSTRIDDFDEAELALLRALADHAAAAISNQRLIERLEVAKAELARRVDAQRTLGEIAARIAVIREPAEVLQSVVEAARRLIDSDGAHLTLMEPGGRFLRPTVVTGGNPAWTEDWFTAARVPDRRRHQRSRRRQGPGDRHRGLPRRSAHSRTSPATTGRRAPRASRHGGCAAARARGRGDRHAGGLIRATASVRR